MASFLYFIFSGYKNRRLGRLICRLRAYVLQNNDFLHKNGVLFDAVWLFFCFSASFSDRVCVGSDLVV